MGKKKIIGIMGPGDSATETDLETAFQLGKAVAQKEWNILTGGRSSGVMEATMKGAKSVGGLTIGVLPSADGGDVSEYVDIPIKTGMGSARNNVNILSSDVVVAVGNGLGTTSEVALAMKSGKKVILLNQSDEAVHFFRSFNYSRLFVVNSVDDAIELIE